MKYSIDLKDELSLPTEIILLMKQENDQINETM